MNTTEVSPEVLSTLKASLPRGAMVKIAEKTGFTYNYVAMVLTGKVGLNDNSRKVIEAAMEVIREAREEVAALEKEINETTFKRPATDE